MTKHPSLTEVIVLCAIAAALALSVLRCRREFVAPTDNTQTERIERYDQAQ